MALLSYRRAVALAASLLLVFLILRSTTSSTGARVFGTTQSGHSPGPGLDGSDASFDSQARQRQREQDNVQKPLRPPPTEALGPHRPIRQRLAYSFPYDPFSRFPNYIWQTWKVTDEAWSFNKDMQILKESWTERHPGFIHELISDDMAIHMIRYLYSGLPDVLEAYDALPLNVLKADFFRYLILLARGGIYTDVDTFAIRSAVDWVPPEVPRTSYGLVIGIEADPDREDWAEWYSRRIQFCQWTIQAKPGHPVLLEIVAHITEETLRRKKEDTLHHDDVRGVVEFTGPALWTDVVMAYFNDERYFDMSTSKAEINWRQFTGMKAAKKVGDTIVLPITSFSPGIRTMNAGEDDDPMAFVKHYFEGVWKPERDRHIGKDSK